MITSASTLAERNMAAAAFRDQIHDALSHDDNAACETFDRLRAKDPEMAKAVAVALSRSGGAR